MVWLLTFLLLLSGCSVVVKDREGIEEVGTLRVNCTSPIFTVARYCSGNRAYSNLVQTGSKVKITNLENNRSITIAVYRREDVEGVCIPYTFSQFLGRVSSVRLDIQRCGKDGIVSCPPYIKGLASWYGEPYHGRESAYGIVYDMYGFYAASRDLPLGTLLRVRNLKNGKEVEVKVIDRGPFKQSRVLDLSYAAAKAIDMLRDGEVEIYAKVLRCGD